MRPLAVMYRFPDPYGEWTQTDYRLLSAYQQFKDEICPKCGNPSWLCQSVDPDIDWKVDTSVCQATAAIEARRWKDDNPKTQPDKKERQSWGRDYYARPELLKFSERTELPTRDDFMLQ